MPGSCPRRAAKRSHTQSFVVSLPSVILNGRLTDLDSDAFKVLVEFLDRQVRILREPISCHADSSFTFFACTDWSATFVPLRFLFLLKRAALTGFLVQAEIAEIVNVGTADNLEWATRLEISRLDIFDVNDVLRRIYLLYAPGSG